MTEKSNKAPRTRKESVLAGVSLARWESSCRLAWALALINNSAPRMHRWNRIPLQGFQLALYANPIDDRFAFLLCLFWFVHVMFFGFVCFAFKFNSLFLLNKKGFNLERQLDRKTNKQNYFERGPWILIQVLADLYTRAWFLGVFSLTWNHQDSNTAQKKKHHPTSLWHIFFMCKTAT